MGLFLCIKSDCRLAAAWFPLLFSSLLLHTIVHGVPSCPRSCSCPSTKEVHCTFRHLTAIPETFSTATERLNLGYNSLTEVEGSQFRSLRQLEMLMLHGNDISRVHPGAFYTLRSLQILKLSYNKLTSLGSAHFEGLVSLIRLHLDHNLINFIEPYTFSGLTSLKLLQLEGNLLKQIHPHSFITVSVLGSFWVSGLKHLHLADNLLEELPPVALQTSPKLELLTLHGNPWNCDCQLQWFVEWSATHEGVVKCKKERGSAETCPQCSYPQPLNQTQLLELTVEKLICERPVLRSPLKQWDNQLWAETEGEPDLPYTRDLEKPLGQLTIVLSDSHGNRAFVSCDLRHPGDRSPITWTVNPQSPMELSVNVSLVTVLECEIDRETLQNLWQLVAYYYETPAILERGQQRVNTSRVTYQYSQVVNKNSPYFTELKGYLEAEPAWLLQPRITLKLNRQQTTTRKLVMDFTTLIAKHINSHGRQEDDNDITSSWAFIRRGTTGRIQGALEGSKINLECNVVTSDQDAKVEWMLPDLSIVEEATDKIEISEIGHLAILNASLSDSGLYHCIVRSKAGVDLMPIRLTIKEQSVGPTAFNGQKILVEKGNSLSLPCEVASPQPSQTLWYLPNNQILLPTQKTRKAEVLENGTLVVRRMTQENEGEYSCLASNLYGVDMLCHMVEVTGGKASEMTKVQTDRESFNFPLGVDVGEGSGGDYQEIIRPFATQLPEKVGQPHNGLLKRTRMKNLKRKPNKSVKELDPKRWAEILAKTKAKPSVPLPTELSIEEPSTVPVQASTIKPSTSSVSTTTEPFFYFTTPLNTKRSEKHSRNQKMEDHYKASEIGQNQLLVLHPTILGSKVPPLNNENLEAVQTITIPSNTLVKQPERKHNDEGRRHSVPGLFNRKRPFQRRRKPSMRRPHPHKNLFNQILNNPQSTVPQTIVTTPTTTTTTTTTNTPTTTTTATTTSASNTTPTSAPTTVNYDEPLPAEYEIEEDNEKYYEYHDYKSGENSEATEDGVIEISPNTHLHRSITTTPLDREKNLHLSQQELPNPTIIPTPNSETEIYRIAEDVVNLQKSQIGRVGLKEQTAENVINNTSSDKSLARLNESQNMNATKEQEKHSKGTERHKEKSKVELFTKSYNSQDTFLLTSHNRQRINNRPSPDQNLPTHPTTAKPTKKPETTQLQVPLHPWLHQNNQERGQATGSRITDTAQDKNGVRYGQVNPSRNSQPPKVPPTSHWSTHHLPHQVYPVYPSWAGQRPFHTRQGLTPTHRPWPVLHPWGHGSYITNRPEIMAVTVKPTPANSGIDDFKFLPPHIYHHNHQNPRGDTRTQTRDHLFLSRLRNRYRQAQLDRIARLGKIATPKPRTGDNPLPPVTPTKHSPSVHRPFTIKPPAGTAPYIYFLEHLKPSKPSSPSFFDFPPSSPSHPTTPPLLFGEQIPSQNPTAAPPFPWLFGGNGKPRIITVSTASVSVLAEDDVFLPCKATGNPEPDVGWTKVSTGATIPANTKHGSRFEVFRNGTFVIKNLQLQDRGQYLCTARNRFGSDRMVITLAVQTEAPQIQPPKSAQISIYLGKTAALDCLASGKPPAQISWILPDRTFVRDAGTIHSLLSPMSLLQNGTLRIHLANFSSKGDYKCIASNAAGADTVTYQLHVAALPPSITEGVEDLVTVQPDRSIYVHCSAKGEPAPALKWTLPTGVHIKASQFLGRRLFVFPNGTLFVKNILPSDNGRYECLATNPVGIAKRTVLLEVKEDSLSFFHQGPPPLPIPHIQSHGSPSLQHVVSALYGSAVYLHCPESTGSSRGTFWQLPSKIILDHQHSPERPVKVFRNGTLRILQLTELDGGNYQCIFQRPNGEDMELFQVKVLMTPPRIEHVRTAKTRVTYGDNFQVDCVATGLPNPEVSWSLPDGTLVNNALQSDDSGLRNRRYVIYGNGTLLLQQMGRNDEGDYTCHATNKLGRDERKLSVKLGPNAPQIELKSQSLVKVKLGESAKLSCQASGEPKPRITWVSPRTDVIPPLSDKYKITDDGTLILKKVTIADEGKYACVAQNSAGDDIKNMVVEAELQEPYINSVRGKITTKLLFVSYQTALIDCRVEGKPEPKLWWFTPYGHSLTPPYLGGRFQVHQNGSLELRGVRKTDAGRYKCYAKNHLGEASLSFDLEVASLAEKPSFANPNIEILPIKQDGSELILECPARGTPIPEISWVLPNGTMLSPGQRLQRTSHYFGNGTLRISLPSLADKGIYRCLARNIAGQAEKRYSLEAGWKPVIRGTTGGMKITYGLSLSLPCTVDSWPQALITWTLPNGVVLDKPQTLGRISFLNNGTLHVRQIAPFDKGTYICRASNSFGSSTLSYPVIVMVFPPRITSTMASITRVIRGTPVMLLCAATGIPKPEISWTLPGRTTLLSHNQFTVQGGIHMTDGGSLIIQNPVLTNSGIYKCNAKNALGTDFKSTYLQVI